MISFGTRAAHGPDLGPIGAPAHGGMEPLFMPRRTCTLSRDGWVELLGVRSHGTARHPTPLMEHRSKAVMSEGEQKVELVR